MNNNYSADSFFTKGTGNVVLCGSTKYFFQAMRCNKLLTFNHWVVTLCGSWGHSFDLYDTEKLVRDYDKVKLLHFYKIYQSNAAVIVTDETNYIGDSTKKEIEFIEKLEIPYFWFNGKEFSGETTLTPKDYLSSYLPIMENINNGTFKV